MEANGFVVADPIYSIDRLATDMAKAGFSFSAIGKIATLVMSQPLPTGLHVPESGDVSEMDLDAMQLAGPEDNVDDHSQEGYMTPSPTQKRTLSPTRSHEVHRRSRIDVLDEDETEQTNNEPPFIPNANAHDNELSGMLEAIFMHEGALGTKERATVSMRHDHTKADARQEPNRDASTHARGDVKVDEDDKLTGAPYDEERTDAPNAVGESRSEAEALPAPLVEHIVYGKNQEDLEVDNGKEEDVEKRNSGQEQTTATGNAVDVPMTDVVREEGEDEDGEDEGAEGKGARGEGDGCRIA